MAIIKITGEEALKRKGTTDWDTLDALTDEQIADAAKNDPDSDLPSDEALKNFKRGPVKKPTEK
ncbi:hypothetical protein V8J88_18200 [Massilia sp. W12]|uniref:hypothetical protein n=1 Tax=Massilia sp. W12 TaxID=3126507 RepID=UPI0030CFCA8A